MVELIELPHDNLAQILSKLPIKTIHALRCVCKTLLDLTSNSNPYFTHFHSQNATQHLIIQFGDSKEYFKNYVQLIIDAKIDTKPSPMFTIPNPRPEKLNKFGLVNACNGLIYFAVRSTDQYSLVCNPITKECVTVPAVVDKSRGYASGMWLGYSPISRKYKVLSMRMYSEGKGARARIHDVGSGNSWRDITSTPFGYINFDSNCAFLNGIGYWLCLRDKFVVSFDFEREIFKKIDAIPGFEGSCARIGIGVIEDRLYLIDNKWQVVDNKEKCAFDVWVMEKGGEWNKKFSYLDDAFADIHHSSLRPLQVLSNGDMIMVSHVRLVCYDTKKNKLRFVYQHRVRVKFSVVVTFVPSFLSLHNILGIATVPVPQCDSGSESVVVPPIDNRSHI